MIVVKLMGGLGNQMFQYAMARTLAHRHECEILIDKSLCAESEGMNASGISLRPFELDVFNIQARIANEECRYRVLKVRKENKLKRTSALAFVRAANIFSGFWRICIYERKDVSFDESLLRLPRDVLLHGYFPSYKYFRDIELQLRDDFTFVPEPNEQNRKMIQNISSCNSISLHIRCGDYFSSERVRERLGVCDQAYYEKAIEFISKTVKDSRFFVFTNDPDYVKNNLNIGYPSVHVTHNSGDTSYEDMRLMSLCKHNIIANSSFSWWGAWLNKNPGKIIVAPSPAFDKLTLKDSDFYPESWKLFPKSK